MTSKHIGFTGTQQGMTCDQRQTLYNVLKEESAEFAHHGDCIGADFQFDAIARSLGYGIIIHPPVEPKKRAFCDTRKDTVRPPKIYLERNHDIVDESQTLIVCPYENSEIVRSGTWATYRYAKKIDKPILLILPSGEVINS